VGLGWRVEWGFGLWFFHLLLYPTINSCNPFNYGLSIYGRNKDNYPIQLSYFVAWILENNIKYMGVLRPSKWKEKKGRHGRIVSDRHGYPLELKSDFQWLWTACIVGTSCWNIPICFINRWRSMYINPLRKFLHNYE
jgi:hypothetical protein